MRWWKCRTGCLPEVGTIELWAPRLTGFGGGIGAFSRELAWALEQNGHSVNLLGKLDSTGKWGGRQVRGGSGNVVAFAARGLAGALRSRPMAVVATHANFSPMAEWAARLSGARLVICAHGVEISKDLRLSSRNALKRADAVLAVSRWTRDRLINLGVDHSRIQVIGNTVDVGRFRSLLSKEELRAEAGVQDGRRVVLTVARLDAAERYKGCDTVIQALAGMQRSDIEYWIVGEGDDADRLRRMAADAGLDGRFQLLSGVGEDALPALFALADVFAMPSSGEGFGIAYLEAMAAGTPVLAGRIDGSRDALLDGQLGKLVDPASVSDVAQGIHELLEGRGPDLWFDPERLRRAVEQAHGRAVFHERVRSSMDHALEVIG